MTSRYDDPAFQHRLAEAIKNLEQGALELSTRFSEDEGDALLWRIAFYDEVTRATRELLVGTVEDARSDEALPWRAIGEAAGRISRQQAEQKFGAGRARQRRYAADRRPNKDG